MGAEPVAILAYGEEADLALDVVPEPLHEALQMRLMEDADGVSHRGAVTEDKISVAVGQGDEGGMVVKAGLQEDATSPLLPAIDAARHALSTAH